LKKLAVSAGFLVFLISGVIPAHLFAFSSTGAAGPGTITEAEWASYLARGTGLEGKLPPPVQAENYIEVFSQPGYHRVEAENITDISASLKREKGDRFGRASHREWLESGSGSGSIHYHFTLPIKLRYSIFARVRGGNQFWKIDDRKRILITPETGFSRVKIGDFNLEAGSHTITVTLPPDSALDVFELITRNSPPIEPLGGFAPLAPLNYGEKATTLVRALNWENRLPIDGGRCGFFEAEGFSEARGEVKISESTRHGRASRGEWVNPLSPQSGLTYRINLPEAGLYTIRGRFWGGGENIFSIELDKHKLYFTPLPGDRFNWVDIFTGHLNKGEHRLDLEINPGNGVDLFEWVKRLDAPGDYYLLLPQYGFLEGGQPTGNKEGRRYGSFLRVEGESGLVSGPVVISSRKDYGDPSGGKWVDSHSRSSRIRFEVDIPASGKAAPDREQAALIWKRAGDKPDGVSGDYRFSDSTRPGSRSGKRWLSAAGETKGYFDLDLRRGATVSIYCRNFGREPFRWTVDPGSTRPSLRKLITPQKAAAFTWQKIGELYLTRGKHRISVLLPPGGGLDLLEIRQGRSCPDDCFALFSRSRGSAPLTWTVDPDSSPPLLRVRSFPLHEDMFTWQEVATLDIPPGKHVIQAELEGETGLDAWELRRRTLNNCQMDELSGQPVRREAALNNLSQFKERLAPLRMVPERREVIPAPRPPEPPDDVNADDITPVSPFKP
jgi:hypothetical protein